MPHTSLLDGTVHPAFWSVAERFREHLSLVPGGGAVCVYHRGEPVVDLWGGVRDRAGRPWLPDTMAPSFSTTKGVAATLLHRLVDRGLLDYGDPVAAHWPEFAQAGKEKITVRHVLSHQSGLYHIRQMVDGAERMLDWDYMVRAIERARPLHRPGRRTGYHGLTFGYLVGEIASRVTGRAFPELVRDEIAAPLGLDGCYVGVPSSELHRAAELMPTRFSVAEWIAQPRVRRGLRRAGPSLARIARSAGLAVDFEGLLDALAPRGIDRFRFDSEETLRAAIPGANGLFTARSLARLYAALAGGGEIDGVRFLSRATLARATREQRAPAERAVLLVDMRWRLGYHAVFTSRGIPPSAFGHFGFGGSGSWADPSRDLAVALVGNGGLGAPWSQLGIVRISGAALAAADARSARLAA